jgi:hypothetical protein
VRKLWKAAMYDPDDTWVKNVEIMAEGGEDALRKANEAACLPATPQERQLHAGEAWLPAST